MLKKILIIWTMVSVILMSCVTVNAQDIEETLICDEYQQYVISVAEQYNIAPELIMAIIETESSGKANAKNGSCKGLMQINVSCHKDRMNRLNVTDIYDPYSNVLVGADYLYELFTEYEDAELVLMLYSGKPNAIKLYESGQITNYARNIIKRSDELQKLKEIKKGQLNNGNIEK